MTPRLPAAALAALFAAATGLASAAGDPATGAAADRTFEAERARCMAGVSGQARDTCLKEAAAARQTARANELTDGDPANARKRCDRQAGDAKRDCLARAAGTGDTTTSGSVKEGGILRSTTTVVPAASAASTR